MATAAAPISLAEYLHTEYEPDCEYIDGLLEERNAGKSRHSDTQGLVVGWLVARKSEHGFRVRPEQRVQLAPFRIRIPDVCLVPADDKAEIIQQPPPLWIEILSPDDRWYRTHNKLRDVLAFGVPTVWIIDPYSNEAWTATQDGHVIQVEDGILRCANLNLEMPLSEVLPAE
jgi:Uma2 family endonuclease